MSKFTPKKKESSRSSARRKRDHVEIVLSKDVSFREKTTGFEKIDFIHNALPEMNYGEIDHSTVFLGKKIQAPLLISCMTGGFARGESINRLLASICEELSLPMGVGSQRQMLDDAHRDKSFRVVREIAPTVPVLGNIGAAEVAKLTRDEYRMGDFHRLVEVIKADALVVHCNPLQELMQPEGNTNFRGVLQGIALLADNLPCPVIIKEVGAGISNDVARRVLSVGVTLIDIAGAGGTSWSGIEQLRQSDTSYDSTYWEWGIPTSESLRMVAALRPEFPALRIIASGGIKDGVAAAKALALGADMVGAARAFLEVGIQGGKRSLVNEIYSWIENIKRIMFLTGARTVAELQAVPVIDRARNIKP